MATDSDISMGALGLRQRESYRDGVLALDFPADFVEALKRARKPENLQILATVHRALLTLLRDAKMLEPFEGGYQAEINGLIRDVIYLCAGSINIHTLGTIGPEEIWNTYFLPNKRAILMLLRRGLAGLFDLKMERDRSMHLSVEMERMRAEMRTGEAVLNELQAGFENRLREAVEATQAAERIDPLTGLGTRKAYEAHVQHLQENHPDRWVAYAILDLDHFKKVNDTYGHPEGDLVLQSIGSILTLLSREGTPFRVGGEELVLMLDGENEAELMSAILALTESARLQFQLITFRTRDGVEHSETLSAGIAVGRAKDLGDIHRNADAELYKAKKSGRNRLSLTWQDDGPTVETSATRLLR